MNRLARSALVVVAVTAACGDGDDRAAPGPLPFVETFDDDEHGWGGTYQRLQDGAYVWDLPTGQRDSRSPDRLIAVEDDLDDLAVSTTFTSTGIDAVSVQCAFEELEGSSRWYDLELARDGSSIRKRGLGSTPVETLDADTEVRLMPGRTELRAECERTAQTYRLALFVDGDLVTEVVDDEPFGRAGAPNLSVLASADDTGSNEHVARFEDFSVTRLP